MSLEQKVAPVVEARSRATGIVIKYQIKILVRFGQRRTVAELAEESDGTARIFQEVDPCRQRLDGKIRVDDVGWGADPGVGSGNSVLNPADTVGGKYVASNEGRSSGYT